jgi:hypothetical protein
VFWRSVCDANATLFGPVAPIPAAQIIHFFTRFPPKNAYFAPQVLALSEKKAPHSTKWKGSKIKKARECGLFCDRMITL